MKFLPTRLKILPAAVVAFGLSSFAHSETLTGTLTETPALQGLPSSAPLHYFGASRSSAVLFKKNKLTVFDETGFPYWTELFSVINQVSDKKITLTLTSKREDADIAFLKNVPNSAAAIIQDPSSSCALNSYLVEKSIIKKATVEIAASNASCYNQNNAYGFATYLGQMFRSLGFAGRISDNPNDILSVSPSSDNTEYDITVASQFLYHMYGTYKAGAGIAKDDNKSADREELMIFNVPHLGETVDSTQSKEVKQTGSIQEPPRIVPRQSFDPGLASSLPDAGQSIPPAPEKIPYAQLEAEAAGAPGSNVLNMDLPPFPDSAAGRRSTGRSDADRYAAPAGQFAVPPPILGLPPSFQSSVDKQQETVRRNIDNNPVRYYSYNPKDADVEKRVYQDFGVAPPQKDKHARPQQNKEKQKGRNKKEAVLSKTTPAAAIGQKPELISPSAAESADVEIIAGGQRKHGRLLFEDTSKTTLAFESGKMKAAKTEEDRTEKPHTRSTDRQIPSTVRPKQVVEPFVPTPSVQKKEINGHPVLPSSSAPSVVRTGTAAQKPKAPDWLEGRAQ